MPVLGLAAFFAYILIFNVSLQEVAARAGQIDLQLYVAAAATVVLDTFFFCLAWHSLLRFLSVKLSMLKEFAFVWVGIFVDTLIPAESVAGEISRVYLVNREQDGTAGRATASVVAQRLIGMGINLGTLLVGALLLLLESQLQGTIAILMGFLMGVTFLFLALLIIMCRRESLTLGLVNAIIGFAERVSRGRWKLLRFRDDALKATRAFHGAMAEYAKAPKAILLASFFSAVSWILALFTLNLTFMAIGRPISWSSVLVISAIFVAVKSIPIGVPFEVGLPEITLTTLFFLFGVPLEIGATATILLRLLTLWLRFFIGFAAQQWVGLRSFTVGGKPPAATAEK